MAAHKNELAVFAKYWEPRRVKTRLGKEIGYRESSQLYHCFLLTLLERLSTTADQRTLVFTPASRRMEFESLSVGRGWHLSPQSTGNLGERMSGFFQDRLRHADRSVVLLGSDSPTIPLDRIERAFRQLEDHDVVLGPTADGGYYLIGMRRFLPAIFSRISWSTGQVWDETVSRLAECDSDTRIAALPEWYDVDSLADLRRLSAELLADTNTPATVSPLCTMCRNLLSKHDDT